MLVSTFNISRKADTIHSKTFNIPSERHLFRNFISYVFFAGLSRTQPESCHKVTLARMLTAGILGSIKQDS